MRLRASLLTLCLFAFTADAALAAGPYAFVTGRRDPRIYAIDLGAALKAANNNTPVTLSGVTTVEQNDPTAITGPFWLSASITRLVVATSSTRDVSGFCTAITG